MAGVPNEHVHHQACWHCSVPLLGGVLLAGAVSVGLLVILCGQHQGLTTVDRGAQAGTETEAEIDGTKCTSRAGGQQTTPLVQGFRPTLCFQLQPCERQQLDMRGRWRHVMQEVTFTQFQSYDGCAGFTMFLEACPGCCLLLNHVSQHILGSLCADVHVLDKQHLP